MDSGGLTFRCSYDYSTAAQDHYSSFNVSVDLIIAGVRGKVNASAQYATITPKSHLFTSVRNKSHAVQPSNILRTEQHDRTKPSNYKDKLISVPSLNKATNQFVPRSSKGRITDLKKTHPKRRESEQEHEEIDEIAQEHEGVHIRWQPGFVHNIGEEVSHCREVLLVRKLDDSRNILARLLSCGIQLNVDLVLGNYLLCSAKS